MKPSIPKGTRDFLPEAAAKRNYIFDTLKSVFAKYAYLPVETPAMEKLETLTGKYGEEGDRLIFKILSRGEKLQRALTSDELTEKNLSEEALRYDLTVPFARMVVQYQNEINFPFKRYQIQPVWRADRPQKGRYREFFQCDVDVIGSNSLLNEIELIQIIDEGFTALGLGDYNLKINNRKLLLGLVQELGIENQFIDFTVALDKLGKIGVEGVLNELRGKDIKENKIQEIKK
jgi:histidyl-tRNA synthetase